MAAQNPNAIGLQTDFDPKKFDQRMMELYNQTPEGVMKDQGDDQQQKEQMDSLDAKIKAFEQTMNTPSSAFSPSQNANPQTQTGVSAASTVGNAQVQPVGAAA